MNPTVILSLIADLYAQIGVLVDENEKLKTKINAKGDVNPEA